MRHVRSFGHLALALFLCAGVARAEVRGRLDVEPARSEIGEPVVWVLSIEHAAGAIVRATTPDLGRAWILLDDQRIVRTQDSADPGTATTRISWRAAALEPGEHVLPAIAVEVEENGVQTRLTAGAAPNPSAAEPAAEARTQIETAKLAVRPALAPDEDAPRAQRGFRAPPAGAEGRPRWPWAVGLLALIAWFTFAQVRKRRRKVAALPPTPLERLDALERRLAQEPDAQRAIVYDALRLLRDSVDEALGETRASSTDVDWVARTAADERVPLGIQSASARLLPSAERIKYALEVPTRFALAELLQDVRHALAALAEARIVPARASSAPSDVGEAA